MRSFRVSVAMKRQIGLVICYLIFSLKSYGDCTPADMTLLSVIPSVVDFSNTLTTTVDFSISHGPFTGTQRCYFFAFMGYGNGTSWANRSLRHVSSAASIPFNVHSRSNFSNRSRIRTAIDANRNIHVVYRSPFFNVSPVTVIRTKQYFAQLGTVPPNLPPGLYTDALIFNVAARLQNVPANDYELWPIVSTRAVQFVYRVEKELDISLVSSGGVFDASATAMLMSFGSLESLEARSASIIIKTNVGYRLKVSSKNGGSLKHTSFSATVPYTMTVSGSTANLMGSDITPVTVSSSASNSPALGFSLPLNIQIGVLNGTEAGGEYVDTVALSIEAF